MPVNQSRAGIRKDIFLFIAIFTFLLFTHEAKANDYYLTDDGLIDGAPLNIDPSTAYKTGNTKQRFGTDRFANPADPQTLPAYSPNYRWGDQSTTSADTFTVVIRASTIFENNTGLSVVDPLGVLNNEGKIGGIWGIGIATNSKGSGFVGTIKNAGSIYSTNGYSALTPTSSVAGYYQDTAAGGALAGGRAPSLVGTGGGIVVDATGKVGSINNTGEIVGYTNHIDKIIDRSGAAGILNYGEISEIVNSGANAVISSIVNNYGGVSNGVQNASSLTGNETAISIGQSSANNGYVHAGLIGRISNSSFIDHIDNNAGAKIETIINTGVIAPSQAGIKAIRNNGTLNTLINLQGAGNSSGPLTYEGELPQSYLSTIKSSREYGQLFVGAVTGKTTFGISSESSLANTTYMGILQGFSSLDNVYGQTGTISGADYKIVADPNLAGVWNLVVSGLPLSNITAAGSPYYTANLNVSVNPVFDGGVLKVSASGIVAPAFVITANNGTIDQNGMTSIFSGGIANSAPGVSGKLIIANSGTGGSVSLSGVNTYSGGTQVNAGANLSIDSASRLGTGALTLIGSDTTPATLSTTANMSIANAISVSGDPVFNVMPQTVTTILNPITDGISSGDVVVSGGGTLVFAAANTYTGLTHVEAGSSLALSGDGSITSSSSLINNGTFDISSATNKMSLKAYTQGATGSLVMAISPNNFQKLYIAGAATLAGTLSLTASQGRYVAGKYTLLTASGGIAGTFNGLNSNLSSYANLTYGLNYDANNVYLNIMSGPTTADTQQSLVNSARALNYSYALQNTIIANSLSYDCNEFGIRGICVSTGGRNTAVSAANGLNNTSGLLIAAYKAHPQLRIGAYADQNLTTSNIGSAVNLGSNTPLLGLFAVWSERLDGLGTEIKGSASYSQKMATITRQVIGTSEPGAGSSQLHGQGIQLTMKYSFGIAADVSISPYSGIRYTQNKLGGYTEGLSSSVAAPLTFSALSTNAATALVGIGGVYRGIPKTSLFASAGMETDVHSCNGTYYASGIEGITPLSFNSAPIKTRSTTTIGASYNVTKNQRLGITGIYRQEQFQAISTTTVMATYMWGL